MTLCCYYALLHLHLLQLATYFTFTSPRLSLHHTSQPTPPSTPVHKIPQFLTLYNPLQNPIPHQIRPSKMAAQGSSQPFASPICTRAFQKSARSHLDKSSIISTLISTRLDAIEALTRRSRGFQQLSEDCTQGI
jgi:hypothetical protein